MEIQTDLLENIKDVREKLLIKKVFNLPSMKAVDFTNTRAMKILLEQYEKNTPTNITILDTWKKIEKNLCLAVEKFEKTIVNK